MTEEEKEVRAVLDGYGVDVPDGVAVDWCALADGIAQRDGAGLGEIERRLFDAWRAAEYRRASDALDGCTLADVPAWRPESEDPGVLIRGRWLERGGSAFIISTSGTGKSVHAMQCAICWAAGIPALGLVPSGRLRVWIVQSEDSFTRIALDRDGVAREVSETVPGVDLSEALRRVYLPRFRSVGAAFLEELDARLADASARGEGPDVLIVNPLLAFVGGPITDGAFVTPFLRGGMIGRADTDGLQRILERHGVGLVAYHHTPKPPTGAEVEAWVKSPFPEYMGAGSADLVNWGRSFLSMMKVPEGDKDKGRAFKYGCVRVVAGKNGGGLRKVDGSPWVLEDGITSLYLSYPVTSERLAEYERDVERNHGAPSFKAGLDGDNRHAWQIVGPSHPRYFEVTGKARIRPEYGDVRQITGKGRPVVRTAEGAVAGGLFVGT